MIFPLYDDVPSRRVPLVTMGIIAMNGVVFLWSQGLKPIQKEALAYQWGFVPARIGQLVTHRPIPIQIGQHEQPPWPWGGPQQPVIVLEPRPAEIALTLVAYLFLHGSWLHLLGNMWFLWLFGNSVEGRLGHAGFLIFYLLGGLAATLAHWLVFPNSAFPVIGASGAIAAVLGGYAVTWPWREFIRWCFSSSFSPSCNCRPCCSWAAGSCIKSWPAFSGRMPGACSRSPGGAHRRLRGGLPADAAV